MSEAALFVVATPIGNLGDMSERAIRVLKDVDIVAAEDTRQTLKLFSHFGIRRKELISYNDHGEEQRARKLVERLVREGLSMALVTDAGTPAISDPGYRLVGEARAAGVKVHPVPGPSALTTLVSVSGLASDRFLFIGFLPTKAQALRSEVASWRGGRASVVFYESPRRLRSTLKVIAEVYPGARLAIGRELTKLHEEIVVSSIEDAMAWADAHESMKGEAVVMVEVPVDSGTPLADVEVKLRLEAQEMFAEGRSLRDVLLVLKDRGLPRQQLYQMLLEVKDDEDYR